MKIFDRKTILPEIKPISMIFKTSEKETNPGKLFSSKNLNLVKKLKLSELNTQNFSSNEHMKESSDNFSNQQITCNIFGQECNNFQKFSEEIKSLKAQLSEEKLKSNVLREIAEGEKKKHMLYKKKFQYILKELNNKDDNLNNSDNNIIEKNQLDDKFFLVSSLNFQTSHKTLKLKTINKKENSNALTPKKEESPHGNGKTKKIKNDDENLKLRYKIEKLYSKINQLKLHNQNLINENKYLGDENKKLKDEIELKNKDLHKIKIKLSQEIEVNQNIMKKLIETKNLNELILKDFKIEKEKNKKLQEQIDKIKNEIEYSKRSLKVSEMSNISNISEIESKQQYEQEDLTLKEFVQKC